MTICANCQHDKSQHNDHRWNKALPSCQLCECAFFALTRDTEVSPQTRKYFKHSLRVYKVHYKNDTPVLTRLASSLFELGFVREHSVKIKRSYRLDFAHKKDKINIEFDGKGHRGGVQPQLDALRDERLISLGWSIFRIVERENWEPENGPRYEIRTVSISTPSPKFERLLAQISLLIG